MRIKGILLLIVCICLTTIFYCLLVGDPKPTISQIHKQLNQLRGVVINGHQFKTINDNDITGEESERKCDQYLTFLGFKRNKTKKVSASDRRRTPTLSDRSLASVWPIFVTAINSDQTDLAKGFIRSFQDFIETNYSLIIYDLGLNRQQILSISSVCNESQTQNSTQKSGPEWLTGLQTNLKSNANNSVPNSFGQTLCTIRRFDYDLFPGHVSDLKLSAFRPIIMQLVLDEWGSALWLDPNFYLIPSATQKANQLAEKGKKEGIISWTIDQPTSSLTHPRMFEYFKTDQNQYYFHRMIKASHLLLYNTERIHNHLMLPWVKCALTPECIAPIGSQASGCRFDKKPLYRYSGCHNYDTSALNVVLGQMFNFNERPYSASDEDKFFRLITIDENYYTDADIIDSDYVSNPNVKAVGADTRLNLNTTQSL